MKWQNNNNYDLLQKSKIEGFSTKFVSSFEIELKVKDFDVIIGNGKSLQIAQKKTAEKFIKKFIKEDIIVKQ